MRKIDEKELYQINGGGITGVLWEAFNNTIKFINDLGKSLGSSLRRIDENSYCPIK